MNRREFLKSTIVFVGGLILAACGGKTEEEVKATLTAQAGEATATSTHTPQPSDTPMPDDGVPADDTATPTETPTPTETAIPCFTLLEPAHEAVLGATGRLTFKWTEQIGAVTYRIEGVIPNGQTVTFDTDVTEFSLYLASLPWGGVYSWQVVALDEAGDVICAAGPNKFSKPEFEATATPKPDDGDEREGRPNETPADTGSSSSSLSSSG